MDNINMQELISFINWEELRIWLLFLFGIIGGVITIRSFSLNNEQRRIDNTFGKSSVSCPLKPSDSAPLKHSTMPP